MTAHSIAGEARLDNRDELMRSLGVVPDEGNRIDDLALILGAYLRWGDACPGRLLGDFAFTVTDLRSGDAFGARDHLGVKPFYYRASERCLAFATRASAIPAVDGRPLVLDPSRVADACVPGLECVDRTSTFFRDVARLPPGHRISFARGSAYVVPYWTPDPARESALRGDAASVEAFRSLFSQAVRCRMLDASAAMLSGGLDSSTIVGFARALFAREREAPLTTLSAVSDDPGCEESSHVRAVLGLPGIEPILIRPDQLGAFRDALDGFIAAIDEPFDDAMVIPMLMYAAARRRGFKAVLDGVDGDIVASHEPDVLDDMLRAGRFGLAAREARAFARFYDGSYAPWSSPTRLLAASAGRALVPGFVRAASRPFRGRGAVLAALASSIVSDDLARGADVPSRLRALWSHRAGYAALTARQRQAKELTHPQLAAALERYHRTAAAHGIEARHPLLDLRVVELCLALPSHLKVEDGWSKRIVRLAAEGLLPDSVRWRRGRWVRLGARYLAAAIEISREFLAGELAGDLAELAPYADLDKVRGLYRRHLDGDPSVGETVWTAAVLSSWLRKTRLTRYDVGARANGPGTAHRLPCAG